MAMTLLIKMILKSKDPDVDNPTNSFVFHSDTATDLTNINALMASVNHFYNNVGTGGTNTIASYLSAVLDASSNACSVEAYDITTHLDGSAHGSPVALNTWTLATVGGIPSLPEGVAATLSSRSSYGTDVEFGTGTRPRARDRNRLYIGPLAGGAITHSGTTGRCQLLPQFITDVLAAAFNLSIGFTFSGEEWVWQQWSRKNASIKIPVQLWMDDRPDYQRRRSDPTPGTRVFRDAASV